MFLVHEKIQKLDENSLRVKKKRSLLDYKSKSKQLFFAVSNDLTSPMMGLDFLSLRSNIELFISKNDGKSYKIAHRSTITPQYTPEVSGMSSLLQHKRLLKYHKTLHISKWFILITTITKIISIWWTQFQQQALNPNNPS